SELRSIHPGRRSGYGRPPLSIHEQMAALFERVAGAEGGRGMAAGPRLEQVAVIHEEATRSALIAALQRTEWPGARQRTARRAVLDLSQAVRHLARAALRDAAPRQARPVFLAALRHPWPPAAAHAARALVQLKDVGALPALRELAKLPPPDEPRREG